MLADRGIVGTTPTEDLQNVLGAVQQQPWTNAGPAVLVDEVNAPVGTHDVEEDAVHISSLRKAVYPPFGENAVISTVKATIISLK